MGLGLGIPPDRGRGEKACSAGGGFPKQGLLLDSTGRMPSSCREKADFPDLNAAAPAAAYPLMLMRFPFPMILGLLALSSCLRGQASDFNIALSRPVIASGATAGGPAGAVTDGDSSTYTAPTAAGVIGFYYQIDLGREYPLQAIDLYSRVNDGANKLSKVRMAVYADNGGVPGVERWGYEIRANASNNLQGGVDHLVPSLHPAGTMRGRFIRLTNVANTSNAPQIAEIEAFEAPAPEVKYFGPNAGNITKTGAPGKPGEAVLG